MIQRSTLSSTTSKMKKNEAIEELGILMRVAKSLNITRTIKSLCVSRFLLDSGLALGLFSVFAPTPRPLKFLATLAAGVV